MAGRHVWTVMKKSVAVALALLLMSSTSGNAMAASIATSGQLTETTPPQTFQTLRRVLDQYQPQVKILSPKPGDLLQDNMVSLSVQVKDLPIYKSASLGLGPHLHLVVDDQPYQSIYDATQPIILTDLTPGTHTVRVFAVRPWDESFKNDGAFAQATFHIFTKTNDNQPDPRKPLLTYSQPQGTYGAEPIMLDFYLTNAPLHLIAQDNPDDATRDWKIKATVNGQSFMLDRWQPIYLKGVKPGKNWLQLEFIDENGNRVENLGNNTARIFTYTPNGTDTLSKMTRGELTIAQAKGIVDPTYTYTPPAPPPDVKPAVSPAIEPTAAPKVEAKAKPKPEPKVETKSKAKPEPKVETKVQPKVDPKVDPKIKPKSEPTIEPNIDSKVEPTPVPSISPSPASAAGKFGLPKLPIVPIPLPIFGKKTSTPTKVDTSKVETPTAETPKTDKPDIAKPIDTLPSKPGMSDRRPKQPQEDEKAPAIVQRKPFSFFNKKEKAIETPPIAPAVKPEAAKPSIVKPETAQPKSTQPKSTQPKAAKPEATKPKAIPAKSKAIQPDAPKPKDFVPPLTQPAPPKPQAKPSDAQTLDIQPRLPSRLAPGKTSEVLRPDKGAPQFKPKAQPKVESKPESKPESTSSNESSNWFDRFRKPAVEPTTPPIAKPIDLKAPAQAKPQPMTDKSSPSLAVPTPVVPTPVVPAPKANAVPKASPNWLDQLRDRLPKSDDLTPKPPEVKAPEIKTPQAKTPQAKTPQVKTPVTSTIKPIPSIPPQTLRSQPNATIKTEPQKLPPAKIETKKAQPKFEPKKVESTKVEPKFEPKKVEPKKVEPKIEPKKVEPKKVEPTVAPNATTKVEPKAITSPVVKPAPIAKPIEPAKPIAKPEVNPSIDPKPDDESLNELIDRLKKSEAKPVVPIAPIVQPSPDPQLTGDALFNQLKQKVKSQLDEIKPEVKPEAKLQVKPEVKPEAKLTVR